MVYVLLGNGFEEVEAITPIDYLRRAKIAVTTVGIGGKTVTGGHGIRVVADIEVGEMDLASLDMIILPGGLGGVASIKGSDAAMEAIRFAWEHGRFVAAICAAPTILGEMGLLHGKHATCYPGCEGKLAGAIYREEAAVVDGKLITGASAGCAEIFANHLIACLVGSDKAQAVREQIVIRPHRRNNL